MLAAITLATTFVAAETRGRDLDLVHDAVEGTAGEVAARPAALERGERVRAPLARTAAARRD